MPTMDDALLSARGLSLRFGSITALDNVDADLWPGEVLAVVGESGSGKTTLLNVLSGRLAPDAGNVWYRDPTGALHDLHAMPAPACAPCTAPTGATSTRTPAARSGCASPPAATSASA